MLARSTQSALRRLRRDPRVRLAVLSLAADVIGYVAVHYLVTRGFVSTLAANVLVSKVLIPLNLIFDTMALVGKWMPTWAQAGKWFLYWLPSMLASTAVLAFWTLQFGLHGDFARAATGLTMFPANYFFKRRFVYHAWAETVLAWLGQVVLGPRHTPQTEESTEVV